MKCLNLHSFTYPLLFYLCLLTVQCYGGHWSPGFMNRHPHHQMHHPHHIRMNALTGPNFKFRYSLDSPYTKATHDEICVKNDKVTLQQVYFDHMCMINRTNEAESAMMKQCFTAATKSQSTFASDEESFKKFICDDKNSLMQRSIAELCFLRGLVFTLNETTEQLVKFEPCFANFFEGYSPSMLEPYAMMADLNEAIQKLQVNPKDLCVNPGHNVILKHECNARDSRNKLQPELCGDKKSEEKMTNWIKLTSCLTCGNNDCNLQSLGDLNRLKDCWVKYTGAEYPTTKEQFIAYSCNSFENAYEKSHLTFKCFAGQTLKHTPEKSPQERVAVIHNFTSCFAEKNPLAYEVNPILKDRYVTEGLLLMNMRKQSVIKWKSDHCGAEDKVDPNGLLTKIEETVNCLRVNASDVEKELLSTCWRGMSKQEIPTNRQQWKDWACSLPCPLTKIKIIRNCYFNIKGGFHSLPIFLHRNYRTQKKSAAAEAPSNEMPKLTAAQEEAAKKAYNLYQCLMKHDIDPDML